MIDTRLMLMEAIARQRPIQALYNGQLIKLAPHVLFERHGDLFVSALNMSKSWPTEEARRLGQFKLAGLGSPDLLEEKFEPLPSYVSAAPHFDDTLLLSV